MDCSTNSTLLISNTYAGARTVAVTDCGPTFAQYVAQASSGARTVLADSTYWAMTALAIVGWSAIA